ncbi:MAG: phosphoribosyltransferase family protein [Polyangia bacterium]
MKIFEDRQEAGARLAELLQRFESEHPLVLALPRGGVPVGYQVARALGAPLDVLIVRKIGAPFQPELGLGAITEGGTRWVDEDMCATLGVTPEEIDEIAAREQLEIERRLQRYRNGRPLPSVEGRTVILVDDGVATGGTARAAIQALRALGPKKIVFAVPVAAIQSAELLRREVDEFVAVEVPADLMAIGAWYRDFLQVDNGEVATWLARAKGVHDPRATASTGDERLIQIDVDGVELVGNLALPVRPSGVVLFAHGSGSSRFSPRNRYVASVLQSAGLGTLLLDLLSAEEERRDDLTGELRFDIDLLAERVVRAVDWLARDEATRGLRIGCFGSSTGAAAALVAAAARPNEVAAVVSRGGRPDLAARSLGRVRVPTLLLVGGEDTDVLELNRQALERLSCEKELTIIAGATHLFEEPGALARVASLAADWFARHLPLRESAATV